MCKSIFSTTLFLFLAVVTFGQGKIRGKITDQETGAEVPLARVKIEGQNKGAESDFDGLYNLSVPAGTYTLIFSNDVEGYISQTREVTVVDKKVTELNVALSKDSSVLLQPEIKVVAQKLTGGTSQEAVDAARRNASGSTDGLGRETLKERGAGDAAEAAQQVTGLSIEGGKRVYVRGLGDRYTKTILNGMEIPGLDPDRNAVQLDIFPSTIIDNITVYKTFLPNLAGDFTGGLVDITTRDFPAQKTIYASGGFGYNSEATFNSNYLGYKGGNLDFLGFDDGGRKLPFSKFTKIPDPAAVENAPLESLTRSFNPVMATQTTGNFLDQNYAFSIGNQINKDSMDYGYNVVLNYRNNHRFYGETQVSEFRKENDASLNRLYADRRSIGQLAENDVIWTALFGQSFKFKKRNKVSVVLFHTQNGKTSASKVVEENFESNPVTLEKTSLQFTQRSISNATVSGLHQRDKWKTEWKLTPTYSKISDPDLRSTVLERVENNDGSYTYLFTPSVGSEVRRIYRDLAEFNVSGRYDMTYNFTQWDSLKSKLKFGVMNTYKTRSFSTYDLNFYAENLTTYSGNPDWYFQEENLWTAAKDSGIYVRGQIEPANNFDASINVAAAYVMNELPITEKFNATYGVRAEHALYNYTGSNNNGDVVYRNTTVLNELSILPSVNLVYKIKKKADSTHSNRFINFRGAYTQTVARPSFKEKSIAQIYDPIQGRRYNGNIDLKQTRIHNADLRWEYFYGRTEMISASAFYKRFIDPIEIVAFDLAPSEVKPVNAGIADVYGAEVEVRKAIGFNKSGQEHISLVAGANFTYVVSRINMDLVMLDKGDSLVSERTLRQENAREGETIGKYRQMYGQAPYIVNGFLNI